MFVAAVDTNDLGEMSFDGTMARGHEKFSFRFHAARCTRE